MLGDLGEQSGFDALMGASAYIAGAIITVILFIVFINNTNTPADQECINNEQSTDKTHISTPPEQKPNTNTYRDCVDKQTHSTELRSSRQHEKKAQTSSEIRTHWGHVEPLAIVLDVHSITWMAKDVDKKRLKNKIMKSTLSAVVKINDFLGYKRFDPVFHSLKDYDYGNLKRSESQPILIMGSGYGIDIICNNSDALACAVILPEFSAITEAIIYVNTVVFSKGIHINNYEAIIAHELLHTLEVNHLFCGVMAPHVGQYEGFTVQKCDDVWRDQVLKKDVKVVGQKVLDAVKLKYQEYRKSIPIYESTGDVKHGN